MRYVVHRAPFEPWAGSFYTLAGEQLPEGTKPWWHLAIEERHHQGADKIIRQCPRMRGRLTVWLLQEEDDSVLVIGTEYKAGIDTIVTEIISGLFDEIFDTFVAYVRMLVT